MSLDISKITLEALSLAHVSTGEIDDIDYQQLLSFAFDSLLKTHHKQQEDELYSKLITNKKNNISIFYTHLTIFITECCRFDYSVNDIKQVLSELLDQDRIDTFITSFTQHKDDIRFILMKYTIQFQTIVDFKWRLDYNVQSNVLEEMKENRYVITIVTTNNNSNTFNNNNNINNNSETANNKQEITFNCDLAQLNDLFGHVKDALSQKI